MLRGITSPTAGVHWGAADRNVHQDDDGLAVPGGKRPDASRSFTLNVAVLSAAVIAISTVAVVREASQNREISESFTNEFAIADSAIQDEF